MYFCSSLLRAIQVMKDSGFGKDRFLSHKEKEKKKRTIIKLTGNKANQTRTVTKGNTNTLTVSHLPCWPRAQSFHSPPNFTIALTSPSPGRPAPLQARFV